MGLVGRLEDLPLPDIIQIVHLSRRTGSLDIDRSGDKYRIFFHKGMIILAQSPQFPDLTSFLSRFSPLSADKLSSAKDLLRSMPGTSLGDLLLEMQHLSPQDLGSCIFQGIMQVVDPLIIDKEGMFSFSLRESFSPAELGYSPETLFKTGGLPPARVLQKNKEISILKDIQESLSRGKELMRGEYAPPSPPPSAVPAPPLSIEPSPSAPPEPSTPAARPTLTQIIPMDLDVVPAARTEGEKVLSRFSILSKEEEESITGIDILILESDPLLRVAAKRHFTKLGFRVQHFNSSAPFEQKAAEVMGQAEFSILILGVSHAVTYEEVENLLTSMNRKAGSHITLVLHPEYNLERQHTAATLGADLILIKPDLARQSAAEAERSLQLFVEQLHLASQRYLKGRPDLLEGSKFHDIATKEKLNRSFTLLKKLIEELAEPEDLSQICLMILRVASEYLERSVLLLRSNGDFVGMGGFGLTGDEHSMNMRVRSVNIPSEGDSIFSQVADSHRVHRGKLRRTPVNEEFIKSLGKVYPSEIIVIPILSMKHVLGFLFGDNAEHKRPIGNTDGLEIFLAQAGPAFDTALQHHFREKR